MNRGIFDDKYDNSRGCPLLSYMMHTRAARKMLPYRGHARGAAAHSAILNKKGE